MQGEIVGHLLQAVAALLQIDHLGARAHMGEQRRGVRHAGVDEQHVVGRRGGRRCHVHVAGRMRGFSGQDRRWRVQGDIVAHVGVRCGGRMDIGCGLERYRAHGHRAVEHHPRLQRHRQWSSGR